MGIISGLPTLTAVEVTSLKETLFEGFFKDTDLIAKHAIETGIKGKKQIIIMGRHEGLSGEIKKACSRTLNSTWAIPSSEKTWDPQYIGDFFGECYDDYMTTFLRWGLKNGIQKQDLTGTELAAFLQEHLMDLINEVVFRIAYFGDTGIADGVGNNLGAGDLKYFNPIDGLFAQTFDIVAADAARQSTTDITTKNAELAFADQLFNDTDTSNQLVTKALDRMFYDADMRLRNLPKGDLAYYVTQSVYDQYERERKSLGGGAIIEVFRRQEGGTPALYVNGIELIAVPFWDRMIQTYFEDGTVWTLPHRALLMPRENFIIGTEDTASLNELDIWHSKDDAKLYAEFGFQLDAKIGVDKMIQAAY